MWKNNQKDNKIVFINSIDKLYKKHSDYVEAFSDEVDKKIEAEKINKKKIIIVNNLILICDMIIDENKDWEKKNITKTILGTIKYCLIIGISYIVSNDEVRGLAKTIMDTNIIMFSTLFGSVAMLGVILFVLSQKLVESICTKRVIRATLKKVVLESKLRELEV